MPFSITVVFFASSFQYYKSFTFPSPIVAIIVLKPNQLKLFQSSTFIKKDRAISRESKHEA